MNMWGMGKVGGIRGCRIPGSGFLIPDAEEI